MSKLIILKGLPASGKSTKALEIIRKNPDAVRLNRDLLREMLFFIKRDRKKGEDWTGGKEKVTKKVQENLVKFLLSIHKSVIIDDYNLFKKGIDRYEQIALEGNHKFEVIELNTSVETCIKRDSKRSDSVGEAVIRDFAIKTGLQKDSGSGANLDEIITFPGKKIAIFDIDGTIADVDHRLHFIKGTGGKDWDGFFGAMDKDTVREGVLQLMTLTYKDCAIVMVTGRPSNYRYQTEEWLKKNNINYGRLLMRKAGDYRPDWIVKEEILKNHFNIDEIEVAIDDRPAILTVWRRNKINTIDVGPGQGEYF